MLEPRQHHASTSAGDVTLLWQHMYLALPNLMLYV